VHKIVILPHAEQDLDDIVEYLSGFYPSTAIRQYDQIVSAILTLEEFPNKFEAYKPGQFRFSYRKMVVGDYLVFYVVNDAEGVVHRIMHGKRDISRYIE
jgi:addiction module RelE/StbE family toxin